jgi:alpha-glucuronidase
MYFEQMTANIATVGLQLKKLRDAIARPLWVSNVSRVLSDAVIISGTVTTVTTVSTVAGITNIGGHDAKQAMIYAIDRANWAQAVRTRIH